MRKLFLFLLIVALFFGCSKKEHKEVLKIATNSWIGYTPLFLAKERGILQQLDIELLTSSSLAEAMEIFSVQKAQLVTTTQHEYLALKDEFNIKPIICIDRSSGGDMILSNKSIAEIKKSSKISVFLEVDSINNELLQTFVQKYKIDPNKLIIHNIDPSWIETIKNRPFHSIIIVTYSPYDKPLLKQGFKIVASTKDMNSLVVIDSICASSDIIAKHSKRLHKLKKVVDMMIQEIQKDPKAAYNTTKQYLQNISYKEFLSSLHLIKWINHPDKKILNKMEQIGYDTSKIIP